MQVATNRLRYDRRSLCDPKKLLAGNVSKRCLAAPTGECTCTMHQRAAAFIAAVADPSYCTRCLRPDEERGTRNEEARTWCRRRRAAATSGQEPAAGWRGGTWNGRRRMRWGWRRVELARRARGMGFFYFRELGDSGGRRFVPTHERN